MALITVCLGVTAASFYEIYEWVVDHWFGQHLFIGETDTVTDLADGFLGAAHRRALPGRLGGRPLHEPPPSARIERRVLADAPAPAQRR